MSGGVIFDIKEQTVHDGPGVRATVFFKGCPLRCIWCHNPEGLSPLPEIMKNHNLCVQCGKCLAPCAHGECRTFNVCARICPRGLIRIAGRTEDASTLAKRLKRYERMLRATGGGITVSGGEPLMQPEFLLNLLAELKPMHTALQTSGYGDTAAFQEAVALSDLVMFDLKLMSDAEHKRYTGVSNALILRNLDALIRSGKAFVARLPMIPGVNITEDHFRAAARARSPARGRVEVEILPYNPFAGAKYATVGRTFAYREGDGAATEYPVEILEKAGLCWRVL